MRRQAAAHVLPFVRLVFSSTRDPFTMTSHSDPRPPHGHDEDDDDEEEDDDYVPGQEKSDCESEASDDVSDEGEADDEPVGRGKRRRGQDPLPSTAKVSKTEALDEEEEKKRSDALWASFAAEDEKKEVAKSADGPTAESPAVPATTESVPKDSKPTVSAPRPPVKRVGLADRLSALTKKKDSVLNKSKQDWERLKTEKGLAEELAEHTKSKQSFVERQAFLQRADVRTFEQEKSVRDKIRARRLD